jgi:hypothetical protein
MKNIQVISTDKPSRLHFWTDENGSRLELCDLEYSHTRNTQHIYITNDEEIKKGDWVYCIIDNDIDIANDRTNYHRDEFQKIILTTDQDLIKDGVQAIDDDFLEWFVKNPSCEEVEIEKYGYMPEESYEYKIVTPKEPKEIIYYCKQGEPTCVYPKCICNTVRPKEEPKQETLEEASWKFNPLKKLDGEFLRAAFIKGAKWQAERMYSEVIEFAEWIRIKDFQTTSKDNWIGLDMKYYTSEELFKQFKKK